MANTLTNLIPYMYEGADVVSRELVGFIPAVTRDTKSEGAALGQVINIPVVGAVTGGNVTPGSFPPDDGDFAPANTTMTISKSRYWPIRWSGEDIKGVDQTDIYGHVNSQRFAQAMRAAVNEIETDLANLYQFTSRAYGTVGTTPFGVAGDLSDASLVRQILEDNGAPTGDLQMVLGSSATANIRGKQTILLKANEGGDVRLMRDGSISALPVDGFNLHLSGLVTAPAVGNNTGGYTSSAAGFAAGSTTIAVITGTGTILAGDIITFAGDTNKYVVATGVAAAGNLVIAEPGLRQVLPASATAITIIASAKRNMAFSKSAIALITRAPALPSGGDMATDQVQITDPFSGMTFTISEYKQYKRVKYELAIAWGVKVIAPRHTAILIG